jgi:hypothetical protein
MNYALLSPEIIYQNNSNLQIVQYVETVRGEFEVCPPLYWVECTNEDVTCYEWYYDISDENFYKIPLPDPIPESIA